MGVDDKQALSTREGLEQGYCVVPSEQRFLLLFTFLKRNLTKKVMVFFSSCASVKYHAEMLNYIDVPVKVDFPCLLLTHDPSKLSGLDKLIQL